MSSKPEIEKAKETAFAIKEFENLIRGTNLTPPSRKRVLDVIEQMKERLQRLEREIDPVSLPEAFFDPSEPSLIGHFVALALVSQKKHYLSEITPFYGSGVYALYYERDAPVYSNISKTETPIYVGKVDPPTGATSIIQQKTKIFDRLREHRRNIDIVTGIELSDFRYRALAVQSGYQTAAESHLIGVFKPIWNNETKILYGIGKHGDSADTRSNNRSPWDTIHPGRKWAEGNPEAKGAETIKSEVEMHFKNVKIFKSTQDVFSAFIDGIKRTERNIIKEISESSSDK